MMAYFLRRFTLILPTLLGVTIVVFVMTRFVPGGPVERMLQEARQAQASSNAASTSEALSEQQLEDLKKYYGFDKPVLVSYFIWLGKVLMLDLGESTKYGDPVWDTIKERLPVSLFYSIMTLILTYGVCIPLGVLKSVKHNSIIDNVTSIMVFVGYAIPHYVLAVALLYVFAFKLEWFPMGQFISDNYDDLGLWGKVVDVIKHAVLPLSAYMAGSFAVVTFMMKNSLMDNLAADYVRTAMSKGVSFKNAILKHAMRNSLIPIATSFGTNLTALLTGSFLIETIFNINGMGLLMFESLVERDYPVVLGVVVISSFLFLIGNIISDICVALVDPRVQFE
ncbi:MAG: ABC transporter permease [Halobacteriovoraceae bacterium]|nr:ABC transporter permease [Halobacteriovoraceae bacterium]